MNRRDFLRTSISAALMAAGVRPCFAIDLETFKGKDVFDRIVDKALKNKWIGLPIGELMGKIAQELQNTPYVAHTLELSDDKEICSVNFSGLDCVTFFETTLCLARILKKGKFRPVDLLSEVRYTRYRGGVLTDYASRLHYTTDWFLDNEKKHVVELITASLPGALPFQQKVGFMSAHPQSYSQLSTHPDLIEKIKKCEQDCNSHQLAYIPLEKLSDVEALLKTGDIVGVCTNIEGIDIAHTGLVVRTEDGVAHFMDASSSKKNMKVRLEPGSLSKALNWSKTLTGAMFARPLEPSGVKPKISG